jgi:O-antigen ligase
MVNAHSGLLNKAISIKGIAKALFVLYVITLFVMVDNPTLNAISEIVFVLYAFFTILYVIQRNRLSLGNCVLLVGSFLLICVLSIFWASDKTVALSKSFTIFKLFVLFLLTYNLFNKNDVEIFPLSVVVAGYALVIYSFYIYGFTNIVKAILAGERLGSEISQTNTFGMYSAIATIGCLYFAIGKNRKIFYILSILPFFLILASGSRKAILMIPLGVFLLIVFKYGIRLKFVFYAVIMLFVFFLILQLPFLDFIKSRLISMFNIFVGDQVDSSTQTRLDMIIFGLREFSKKPFLGYGIDNFRVLYGELYASAYAHNNFIELLVDVGLLGFVIYYSIYLYLILKLLPNAWKVKNISVFLFIMLCTMLIMDIGVVSYYSKFIYITFCFCFVYIKDMKTLLKKSENIGAL